MGLFTGIGLALGATAATAFSVGAAATVGAIAIGAGAYALGGGFDSKSGGSVDSRVSAATGQLTEAEAQSAAKKRAFRSGVLFTSPTGLDADAKTSSAKLR